MLKGIVSGEEKDIVRIPMKGKNLFDEDNAELGKWVSSDGSIVTNATYAAGYNIKVETASNFAIKYYGDKPYSYSMVFYDSNGDFLSRNRKISPSTSYDAFTVPENAVSARFQVAVDTREVMTSAILKAMKLMLNLGSTALPYEPYGYQEGWEVRDSQDRLIWGREDILQTATGTLPFKGYSLPVKVKSLLGNAVQNGTPSPDNIVTPEMCGVPNENLSIIDTDSYSLNNWYYEDTRLTGLLAPGTYTISFVTDSITAGATTDGTIGIGTTSDYTEDLEWFTRAAVGSMTTVTVTLSESKCLWARFVRDHNIVKITCSISVSKIRVEEGSTAYGWKVPLTNAGQTIPVYLGEVPTVRRVRKLVLTGEEDTWGQTEAINSGFYFDMTGYLRQIGVIIVICSHYVSQGNINGAAEMQDGKISFYANATQPSSRFYIKDSNCANLADFKSYLSAQYAAGHPVTVWYVLSIPETTISNEPLCKISTYADELNSTVATLPEIPTTTGQNTLTVDTNLAPSSLTVEVHAKKIHYGFKIDKSNDNSESAVTYTHDAVTMTPAHMDFTNDRFDYGSWGNAFFVRDCYPVALNLDGTIAYRLDPDDHTKKTDGTASDIFYELLATEPSDWSTQWKQYYTKDANDNYELNSQDSAPTFAQDTYYKLTYNSSFTGNFMMAFPKVWFYRHEDSQYNYIEISNYKLSDDWKCYAHINASGQEVDFIYLPLFKGVIKDSKLRSLPGQIPQCNTTATYEVNAATALGSRWQIWDHSSVECLNDLLTLMSKSIDSQGRFGQGRSSGYDSTDTVTYGKLQSGTLIKKGKFHGYSATTKEVKVFGIEGFWANRWDRLQGMLLVDNVWKIKMTPPYNFTGTDFVTLSNTSVPTGNGYLSKVQTSEYGSIPASIDGGSSTKYFKDYFYKTVTDTRVALRGGSCAFGASCGFRFVGVYSTASASTWAFGASPLYK